MARLPTVADLGARPIPRPQRDVTRLTAAEMPGQALARFGGAVAQLGDDIHMRDATAAAKERDAYASDEIRKLLYDPEAGFLNLQGRAAVDARSTVMEQIEALRSRATEGLNRTASEMLSSSLTRRVEGALNSIDQHTSGARRDWLTGASSARMTAALQDGLWNFGETKASLATIQNEIDEQAALNGWSTEERDLKFQTERSKLYRAQIERVAGSDPIAAMEYLRQNQDLMLPSDVAQLEANYSREVKVASGRAAADEAFVQLGDMSYAMKVAADTLGMSETEQRETLQEYIATGGANLDPAKTAWCAAIMNGWLAKAGLQGTGSNLARSFLNWGQEVQSPQIGDLVVLSRGDSEWQGHVGFFRGFDENGNVLILGGNQGDAVTIAPYDAGRVLGYRRAVEEVDEVDAARVMQRLVQIEDPIERDAAIDQFNKQVAAANGVAVAERNEARDQAFSFIEMGEDIDRLPFSVRQAIGQEGMSSLRAYQRSVEAGQQPETDQAFKTDLLRQYSADPRAFAQTEPMEWINRLSPGDFDTMRNLWASARGQTVEGAAQTLTPRKTSELMSLANYAVGSVLDDEDERAAFNNALVDWAAANPEASKNDQAVKDQINRMLVEVTVNPPGLRNQRDGMAFSLDYDGDPLDPDDDLTLEDVIGARSTFRLGGQDVPPALVDMFMQSYAANAYQAAFDRAPDMDRDALIAWARENGAVPTARELVEGLLFTGLFR